MPARSRSSGPTSKARSSASPCRRQRTTLKTYSDIATFKDELDGKIYGIEAGSSANATISEMIASDKFGLKDFELVEWSEQAMLAQVERAAGMRLEGFLV